MQFEEVQLHHQSPFRTPTPPYYNHIRASLRSPSEVYELDVQDPPVNHGGALGQRFITAAAICPLYSGK